jgi:competence protein ComEC
MAFLASLSAPPALIWRQPCRRLAGLLRREPLPSRPLVVVAAALLAGSAAAQALPPPGDTSLAVPCWLTAVAAVSAAVWAGSRGHDHSAAGLLLLGVALAGGAWSAARFDLFSNADLAWQLGESPVPVAIEAEVIEAPRPLPQPVAGPRSDGAVAASESLLAVTAIRDGSRWRPATGRAVLLVRGDPPSVAAGSTVRIFGRGLRPMPPLNPGEFDVAARARTERCLSVVRTDSPACVTTLTTPSRWSVRAALDRVRDRSRAALAAGIAADRLPVATALLLGDRSSLPRQTADTFVVTGAIHVLAISGLHVGLLAGGLFIACRCLMLPREPAILAVAVSIGLYALLVGAGTPVVRATLLVWAACLAAAAGRRPDTVNALAGAAILLLVWRPAEVLAAGAQLSFISTGVLVGVATATVRPRCSDPIEKLVERSRSRGERLLRRLATRAGAMAVAGLAVWLAAAPLVAARFHIFSPVAVLANLLIAPLVPVAMACGLLCLISAPVSMPLAAVFATGCDAVLAGIEGGIAVAARLPAGHAWVAGPAGWWVAGWYALLAATAIWGRRDLVVRGTTWATLAVGWGLVGLLGSGVTAWVHPQPPGLRVVMTAIGHGCGILVRSPTGRCLLYDAGRLGGPAAAQRSLAAVLWSEGVERIDTLVVSHADADHFNAVPALLERFRVGRLLVPASFLASESRLVSDLLICAADRGVPVETARAGDAFAIDPLCRVRVLHPADDAPPDGTPPAGPADDNASSLVLSVEAAGRRLLLTGDLEGEALAAFAASGPGECDVLVAPHHGSRTSLPADIARATRPGLVLVSGRGGRGWPEVQRSYEQAAGSGRTAVLKTGSEGAVAVTLTAGEVSAERFWAGRWRRLASPDPQATAARGGRVSSQPAASSSSWLATYAPSSSSTPLVKP